jgi:hypothetical protein
VVKPIELNEAEKALLTHIIWDQNQLKDHGAVVANLERIAQLAQMLFARKAIPAVRTDFFLKPEMNPGGHGKSRKQVFEKNGTKGEAILRHPHFVKYLRYFIFGPDLPEPTVRGFCEIIEDDAGTTGEVLDQITAFVRSEIRSKGLDRNYAAEEFFKLAHEIDKPELAESARSAAKRMK